MEVRPLMRFLIVGAGSIGSRHGRTLANFGHRLMVWDADPIARERARRDLGAEPADGLAEGLGRRPDGVLVCTPPASHVSIAHQALEADAHVFVEKPLAHSLDDVPALLDFVKRVGRVLAVGFNLRFLPGLRRVKTLVDAGRVGKVLSVRAGFGFALPRWRAGQDYRVNYATRAVEGGGVLLDASHEFDYLGWLFGDAAEVFCAAAHVSELAGDTEDLAEITLRFSSGLLAQVHLDYLRHWYRRDLEIIGEDGVITWDYATRTVVTVGPAPDQREVLGGAEDGPNEQMYEEEMRHFIRCIEKREDPLVDGVEAVRSLRIVDAAKRSATERRWVAL